jgi:hypothetical protein
MQVFQLRKQKTTLTQKDPRKILNANKKMQTKKMQTKNHIIT